MNLEKNLENLRKVKNYMIENNNQENIIELLAKVENDFITEIYNKTNAPTEKAKRSTFVKVVNSNKKDKQPVLVGVYEKNGKQYWTDLYRGYILDKPFEDMLQSPAMKGEGTYPNVDRIIPFEENLVCTTLSAYDVKILLARIKTIEKVNKIKLIKFTKEELHEMGIEVEYNDVTFNAKFIEDALKVMGTNELKFWVNKNNISPCMFTSDMGKAIIAPIRNYD